MLLILIVILLVAGIAFYQAVQGFFSAMIMTLATLLCVCVAFNFYEPLGRLLHQYMPEMSFGVALMGLLFVPLFGLRFALDKFLSANLVVSAWLNRIGGGVLGLLTSLLLVGTMLLAMQMLPFGGTMMGYAPYTEGLTANGMFPYPMEFTLGSVKSLSGGALSLIGGDKTKTFGYVHDNLLLEWWGVRNRPLRGGIKTPLDGLKVEQVVDISDAVYAAPAAPKKDDERADPAKTELFVKDGGKFSSVAVVPDYPGGGTGPSQVLSVRATVSADCRDEDNYIRLSGTQFRLVTDDGRSWFPVGFREGKPAGLYASASPGKLMIEGPGSGPMTVDLIYRIPYATGGGPRKAEFMSFRAVALADMPAVK